MNELILILLLLQHTINKQSKNIGGFVRKIHHQNTKSNRLHKILKGHDTCQ